MGVLLVAIGYLAGSIPTGVLLATRAGIDLRRAGSGNIGATNVTRTAGRRLGLATLVGDVLKGAGPTALAVAVGAGDPVAAGTGLAAVVGHVLPFTIGFRGGKGVATALGVLAVLSWPAALVVVLVFVAVVRASRWVSLGSIVAALLAPLALAALGSPGPHVLAMGAAAAIIVVRHRENVGRMIEGSEPSIGRPRSRH